MAARLSLFTLRPTCISSVRESIISFIDTWNELYAHPFNWSYTGEGLHAKAVRRFCTLLSIETNQMECKFLTSQLLLMSNIAMNYLKHIPLKDCERAGVAYGRKQADGITFHDIRRTTKTLMAECGMGKSHRDAILGHSPQDMDAHYIHLTEQSLQGAMTNFTNWLDQRLSEAKEVFSINVD